MSQKENFLLRLLDKLNTLGTDTLIMLTLCCGFASLGSTIVGGMVVSNFSPPDPSPSATISPAMQMLKTCVYNASDPELKKYYTEKMMELEEKENSRKQIVVLHQIAPIATQTHTAPRK